MSKPKATDPISPLSLLVTAGATHTWDALVKLVSEPTQEQLDLYAVRTPVALLIERGTHILK